MGISRSAVRVLLHEAKRAEMNGRILTLGRQDIFITRPELLELMQEFGLKPVRHAAQVLSRKESEAKAGLISDQHLFLALGFSECKALDASGYEDADILFDLNKPETPANLVNQWDAVLDGGTIEHVFHTPNVLANIFRFLKVGGRIIHMAPSSNHIDHGFYMFSPTLFWDYYKANGYDVNVCQIFRYTTDLYAGFWDVSDYIPGALTRVSLGGLDDALYGVILVATKTEHSTCDVIPQQGLYKDGRWQSKVDSAGTEGIEETIELEPARSGDTASGKGLWHRVKRRIAYRLLGQNPALVSPPMPRKGLGLRVRYRL